MFSTAYVCCCPHHTPTAYERVYAVGLWCGQHNILWSIYRGEQYQCSPHHMSMVWGTHILWTTCFMLWRHIVWVYTVGITTICCGEHMLWEYTVDDTVYPVGNTSANIPWVLCCGQHRHMMWVTLSSTVYIHVIHNIQPTVYECVYTVDDMVWITLT